MVDEIDSAAQAMWGPTLIRVLRGDITKIAADVIVNAANSSLLGGGGVDGAIHDAAGPELLDACSEVVSLQGNCPTGESVITTAGRLPASHVVHTVGPVFTGKDPEEHDALLAWCYEESLRLGAEVNAESISFPNISTGVYRFPKGRAVAIVTKVVRRWLEEELHNYTELNFVCFDHENHEVYKEALND